MGRWYTFFWGIFSFFQEGPRGGDGRGGRGLGGTKANISRETETGQRKKSLTKMYWEAEFLPFFTDIAVRRLICLRGRFSENLRSEIMTTKTPLQVTGLLLRIISEIGL